jgi:hypothetical protein
MASEATSARRSVRHIWEHTFVHSPRDLDALTEFWAALLHVERDAFRLQRKSNSNQLKGRTWRSVYGVLTVRTSDTYIRARLQAWMDRIAEEWLASAVIGA